MNERIVSEINLMSEEAMNVMINDFKIKVNGWCSANVSTVLSQSV
jgi:hypothetical protein